MDDDRLDRIFKALADPTRRRIVDRLYHRPDQTLFEICTGFVDEGKSLSRQAISQHLDMLEAAGLVTTTWRGRTKIHALDIAPLGAAAYPWLKQYLAERQAQ